LQVNFQAVKQRFVDTGRKPTLWARSKKIGPELFRRWLNQRYIVAPGGLAEQKYMALLEEDDLLVREEEESGKAESESGGRGEGESAQENRDAVT